MTCEVPGRPGCPTHSRFSNEWDHTPSGTLTTLHTFDGTDGELPYSTLLEGTNGDLYGTTEFGASSACSEGCGTIFSLSIGLAP